MVIYPTYIKKEILKNTDKEIVTITITDTSKKSTNKSVNVVVVVFVLAVRGAWREDDACPL